MKESSLFVYCVEISRIIMFLVIFLVMWENIWWVSRGPSSWFHNVSTYVEKLLNINQKLHLRFI
jgi:hypothetical protein